jgi:hypothetical protein
MRSRKGTRGPRRRWSSLESDGWNNVGCRQMYKRVQQRSACAWDWCSVCISSQKSAEKRRGKGQARESASGRETGEKKEKGETGAGTRKRRLKWIPGLFLGAFDLSLVLLATRFPPCFFMSSLLLFAHVFYSSHPLRSPPSFVDPTHVIVAINAMSLHSTRNDGHTALPSPFCSPPSLSSIKSSLPRSIISK